MASESPPHREILHQLEVHTSDPFAHGPMVNRLMLDLEGRRIEAARDIDERVKANDGRISRLERFQFTVMGGLLVVSALLGGGALVILFNFSHPVK